MRRIATALLLALVLPLAACGSGGDGDDFFGTLEVCNDDFSDFIIEDVEVDDGFTIFSYTGVDLFPGECDFIDDFFPDTYDVTLFWSDGLVQTITVFIDDDEIETVTGLNQL